LNRILIQYHHNRCPTSKYHAGTCICTAWPL